MTYANKAMTTAERHLMGSVIAAFAMVLVSVTGVGVAISLRVAGIVHVLDMLGE